MNIVCKLSLIFIFIFLFSISLFSQQSLNSSGGDGKGSGGSVSFSIGQIVYKAGEGSDIKIIEGVQQPYEIFVVTGINNNLANLLNIQAYPNPTMDYVNLSVDNFSQEKLYYRLFDMHGRLLEIGQISQNQTQLNLYHLPSAPYLLKVMTKKQELRTFKIFKT